MDSPDKLRVQFSRPGAVLVQLLRGDIGALLGLVAVAAFFMVADRVWGEGYFTTVRNLRSSFPEASICQPERR